MRIGGFQKTSLLDYQGHISAIIWTVGCNFNCPFCYNPQLVNGNIENISEEEIFLFLKKRKGLLDGISISGGEPLLQNDIDNFIKKAKDLDYLVKIDTNGTFPDKLEKLIYENLVDYIAMDVKAPKDKYNKLTGVDVELSKIEKSVDIIRDKAVDYEFKTTFIPDLLTKDDVLKIAEWLKGSKKFYLQQFKVDTPLVSLDFQNLKPYPKKYLEETLDLIKQYFEKCELRGA